MLAESVDPYAVAIGGFTSLELGTVKQDDDILEAVKLMRTKGIRRVPVEAFEKVQVIERPWRVWGDK